MRPRLDRNHRDGHPGELRRRLGLGPGVVIAHAETCVRCTKDVLCAPWPVRPNGPFARRGCVRAGGRELGARTSRLIPQPSPTETMLGGVR